MVGSGQRGQRQGRVTNSANIASDVCIIGGLRGALNSEFGTDQSGPYPEGRFSPDLWIQNPLPRRPIIIVYAHVANYLVTWHTCPWYLLYRRRYEQV